MLTKESKYLIERYNYIGSLLKRDSILDIGCGPGYGSFLLGAFYCEIVGIDPSEANISYANRNLKINNTAYYKMEYQQVYKLGQFDYVICLDIQEKFKSNNNYIRYLDSLHTRCLVNDGKLFFDGDKEVLKKHYIAQDFQELDFGICSITKNFSNSLQNIYLE